MLQFLGSAHVVHHFSLDRRQLRLVLEQLLVLQQFLLLLFLGLLELLLAFYDEQLLGQVEAVLLLGLLLILLFSLILHSLEVLHLLAK